METLGTSTDHVLSLFMGFVGAWKYIRLKSYSIQGKHDLCMSAHDSKW